MQAWISKRTSKMASTSLKNPVPLAITAIKIILFLVCLIPLAHLAWGFQADELGANPIEAITRGTGDWTLRFLLITLAVTPLRRLTSLHWLIRLRRMLGLYAFFYALLHFTHLSVAGSVL